MRAGQASPARTRGAAIAGANGTSEADCAPNAIGVETRKNDAAINANAKKYRKTIGPYYDEGTNLAFGVLEGEEFFAN